MTATTEFLLLAWALVANITTVVAALRLRDARRRIDRMQREIDEVARAIDITERGS